MPHKQQINNLSLMLITDRSLCKQSFLNTIELALKGGVKTVQLREKGLTTYELYSLAREARKMTADYKANFIVNDRVDIALAVEADGVHLGWQSLPFPIARGLIGSEKIIGISTHSRQEALHAQDCGADYITFGPIFDTPSKAGLLKPTGTDEIKNLKTKIKIPLIALGGISEKNIESVLAGGADGIAVISSIMHADNPEESAKNLYKKIAMFKTRNHG
jgi:thiamine-phosphate pyrophosphorylase